MNEIINGIREAFKIIFSLDKEFIEIVTVSIKISFASTFFASLFGIPFGIWIGTSKCKGIKLITSILNTLMALPTVVVGLLLYSFLSRKGPLGHWGLLFTPYAMIMGQFILVFPIVSALTAGGIKNLGNNPLAAAQRLGAGKFQSITLYFKEARFILITSMLAGFGRVFAEVGVSMMLGGNIRFYTRNITTAIALETSKGAFSLGIALGIVLLLVAFIINIGFYYLQTKEQ